MALAAIRQIATPRGRFLVFETDAIVGPSLEAHGAFEPHLQKIALEVFRRRGGGVLVDAGAYVGTFSIPVALATGCAVAAFEAQRLVSQLLAANYVLNGIDRAWVNHVALGGPGHPATRELAVPDYARRGNFAAYSVDPALLEAVSKPRMALRGETEAVPVRRLDDWALDDVFLVKLDVEGHELEVLRGALGLLEGNGFPPLLFEAWREPEWAERKRGLLAFVEELGYAVQAMDENFFAQHRSTPAHQRLV